MKNIWNILNKKWYIFVILTFFVCLICFFVIMIPNQYILRICQNLPLIVISLSLVSGVIRTFKRSKIKGLFQIVSTLLIGSIWVYGFSLFLLYGANDFFADNLRIPNDMGCEKTRKYPFINDKITPGSKETKTKNDFELSYSFQPGIYFYEAWLSNLEPGDVFFRVYEITKDTPLSAESVLKESRIRINEKSAEIKYHRLFEDFTIYEGDWGKPYCARFELWYKELRTKQEKKILEKNFIIEGWQR